MEPNPYEAPKHTGMDRPAPPKPKKPHWTEYAVVIVIVVVLVYLLIPAIQNEYEKRTWRSKYVRDPKTGHIVPRDELHKQAEPSED
jgi:hypothetical protein